MAAAVQQEVRPHRGAVLAALLLGLAGCLSSGCVFTGGPRGQAATAGKDGPCQIAVRWENEVAFTPDPVHGGKPSPALVGRVMLFNQRMLPMEGDGSLHVELADATVTPPKVLERWNIDPATMQKYQRKDFVGVGYNVLLPWTTYNAATTSVQLRVAYQSKKGAPLYSSPSTIALGKAPVTPVASRSILMPRPAPQVSAVPPGR